MENHPRYLTDMAYEWCSVICMNYQNLVDGQRLLFLSLEIGFRHINPKNIALWRPLTHSEHHHKLADIVFGSGDNETIADLLLAWTFGYGYNDLSSGPLITCARHITLQVKPQPFPSRLRKVITHSIGAIGYKGFREVGMEGFIALLDSLHVVAEDGTVGWWQQWTILLLDIIQSSGETQHLSHHYWELLIELSIFISQSPEPCPTYNPEIITSLKDAQEWDKLEHWMGVVWMVWPPKDDETMEKGLKSGMQSLFHHQPGAIQKLQQWMGQWSAKSRLNVPELFRQICEEADLEMAQQGVQ